MQHIKEYQNFNLKITQLDRSDLDDLMLFKWKIFGNVYMSNNNYNYDKSYKQMSDFTILNTNFNLSIKIKDDDKIIGIYCFDIKCVVDYLKSKSNSNFKISYKEDLQKYKDINGLHCLTLAVDPVYRDFGIGKSLINESYKIAKNNGCSYLFGAAFSKLDNINYWLKRRRVVATVKEAGESDFYYVTLADI